MSAIESVIRSVDASEVTRVTLSTGKSATRVLRNRDDAAIEAKVESECEHAAWQVDADLWDWQVSKVAGSGWVATCVLIGRVFSTDPAVSCKLDGIPYRVLASDPEECWTRDEALEQLCDQLKQVAQPPKHVSRYLPEGEVARCVKRCAQTVLVTAVES